MAAIPPHDTPVVDHPWDGPAAVAAAPQRASVLRQMHASMAGIGDPNSKAIYAFPHHDQSGAAVLSAVSNGLARLPQANVPTPDKPGIERHLQHHLDAVSAS